MRWYARAEGLVLVVTGAGAAWFALLGDYELLMNPTYRWLTAAGALVGVYNPATLTGYRGVYELPNGNILTTTATGVHEINRSGNLVETKISGVSARYIELIEEATPVELLSFTVE